jgi:hypothetical protein
VLPQHLNAIELWTVERQVVQIQSLLGPPVPLFLHVFAFVNPGIVEQDDSLYRMRLARYLIKESDHARAVTLRRLGQDR